jgi:glutamate carboxypeptidase
MNAEARAFVAYFQSHKEDILEFTRWLVEQESMSRDAAALDRLAHNLADRFSSLNLAVDIASDPRFGSTLCARGSLGAAHPSGTKTLMLVGHIDTVWPSGTLAARPFTVNDGRAYGPGIFDMKAGIAITFYAVQALLELKRPPRRPVLIMLTCDEETGTHFSRPMIEDEARHAHAALVLEPPIPGGAVKTARKGVGEFDLSVRGRPAHAGNEPRAGISAITELAHQILAIQALTDWEKGTTLNVGVVHGGVLSNVIAAEARAAIDMRFESLEEGERIEAAMQRLQPTLAGARLEVSGGINRPPLHRTDGTAALFERARTLAQEFDYELREGSVGGGSDGNFIGALGVPVLDGLGVDGAGAHAEHEHIVIDDIPLRAALLARLIETL